MIHPNHDNGIDILHRVSNSVAALGKTMVHHVAQEQATDSLNRGMDRLNDSALEPHLEAIISHHSLANYAHEDENYDGANRALQVLTNNVRNVHQLSAQHIGDTHPMTVAINQHLGNLLSLSNDYQRTMGARDYTTDKKFANMMRRSGL